MGRLAISSDDHSEQIDVCEWLYDPAVCLVHDSTTI